MVAIQGPAERLPSPIARLGREEKKCPVSAFRLPAFGTSSPLHPCASVHHHLCSTTPADSRNILHLFDLVGCYGAGHNHHTSGSSTATRAWTQRQSACRTRPSTAPSLLVAPVVGEGCGRCAMLRRCAEGSQRQHARSSGPTSQTRAPAVEQLQRSRTEPRFAKSAETQCAGQERRGRVATSQNNCSAAWSRSPQRFCQHRFKQQHPQQPRKDETTTNSTAVLCTQVRSLFGSRLDSIFDTTAAKECPRFRGSGC